MEKLIRTLQTLGEDGQTYHLRFYQDLVDIGTRANPGSMLPGLKRIETENGRVVNYVSKGVYRLVDMGVILRSDAEDAP